MSGVGAAATTLSIARNLAAVRGRIAEVGGAEALERCEIVCVTKLQPVAAVYAAWEVGLRSFGENYLEGLEGRRAMPALEGVQWHFLGALQSRKIPAIARLADVIHSVAREKELRLLSDAGFSGGVFIQLRSDDIDGRNGTTATEVTRLVALARDLGLNILGVMGVASVSGVSSPRAFFRIVKELSTLEGLEKCSMGMSDDFEDAVAEGSTTLRLGRVLLGERASQ